MKNLFKYAASYWKAMIAIVLILVVQAYCDLSLPAYTSDIVNVGIQQGGIEDEVPRQIATEEMEKLLLFVSEDDQQTVMDAYTEDNTSYKKEAYVLKDSVAEEENTMENLKDILQIPMMMTSGIESGSDTTKQMEDKLKEQMSQGMAQSMPQGADQTMPEGMPQGESQAESQAVSLDDMSMFDLLKMLPAEQRATMVEKIEEQMSEMPDTILDQASVSFCRSAYKDLGMDMDQTQIHYLLKTGGQMAALALLGMVASIMVAFLASRVGASAGRDLRSGVFHKVVGFSNNEFNHFSTASLITRSTNDIQQIQMLIVMLLRMVLYAPILAIGGVLQVMKTNVSMSWIIGLAVIIIAFVVLLLFLVVMPKFKVLQNLVDKLNLVTREILTGLPVIRAFSTEKHEEERFDDANRTLTKTNLFVNRAMTFMMPVMMLVMNGVSVLIVWTGAHGISDGKMQVGDMMAFIQYTMQIIMSFLMITAISIMLPRANVAAGRICEVLEMEPSVNDPEEPVMPDKQEKGTVEFDHVSFAYPEAGENVINDITFKAEKGQTVAIIGSTGSGKSTLINLIPRFYDATQGNVLVFGKPVKEQDMESLRSQIAVVPQKAVLFAGTIRENMKWGKEDATDEEIMEALTIAQAAEVVQKKEGGLDAFVEQGGKNLSGGQRQRLTIARALVRKPRILILDDSASALDFATDAALRKAIREMKNAPTVFIVSQRTSSIRFADQILVLDDGKSVGVGTHDELLTTCSVYKEIYDSQYKKSGKEA